MTKLTSLFLLRLSLGFYFLYAGFSKIIDPTWSAVGYLNGAQGFLKPLYNYFAGANVLPIINVLNEWGLALIGLALILGLATRFASFCGIILMALYYLALSFPYPDAHSLVVDQHIIFITIFLVIIALRSEDKISLLPKLKNSLPKIFQ
ncbi:MAG: DoxX family membrane protein [Minisyncoccia bacterium]